jgi:hypothetical protein
MKRDYQKFVDSKKEMSIEEYNEIGICEAEQGSVLVYENKFHIEKNNNVHSLTLERSEYYGSIHELEKLLFIFIEEEFPIV